MDNKFQASSSHGLPDLTIYVILIGLSIGWAWLSLYSPIFSHLDKENEERRYRSSTKHQSDQVSDRSDVG